MTCLAKWATEMEFEYVAWGSGEIVVRVMRALAVLGSSSLLSGALVAVSLFSLLLLATGAAFNPNPQTVLAPVRMLVALVVALGVLLLPSQVTVTDRFDGQDLLQGVPLVTHGSVVVSNVPFGVALPATVAATLGNTLTRALETAMAPVNAEDRLSSAGLWLSARALRAMAQPAGFVDTNLPDDFRRFVVNCTYFDVQAGRVSTATLRRGDLLTELGATAGGLTSVHGNVTATGAVVPVSCPLAWAGGTTGGGIVVTGLRDRMETEGRHRKFQACHSLQGIALALDSAQLAAAKQAAQDPLAGSASTCGDRVFGNALRVFGFNSQVVSQFQELVAIELMRDSTYALSAHDPQAIALAGFLGRRQRDATYVVAGELAALTLPALRGLLEAIVLALLPLLLLLGLLFFEQFGRYLKNGLVLVVWLQLWPPVMAIVNNVGLWVQVAAVNEHAIIGNGRFTLAGTESLLADLDTQLALSRYMLVLVPLISWALVRAGEFSGSMLAGRLLQPAEQAASQAAHQAARNNWSTDQVNLAPRTAVGPHVATVGDSWGGSATHHPQLTTMHMPANEPGHLAVTHSQTVSTGLQRRAEQSQSDVKEQRQQYSQTVENAYQQAFGAGGSKTLNTLREQGVSDQTSMRALQGVSEVARQTESKLRAVGQREGSTQVWSMGHDHQLSLALPGLHQKAGFSGKQDQDVGVREEMRRSYDQLGEESKSAIQEVGQALAHHEGVSASTTHAQVTSENFQATMREAQGQLQSFSETQQQSERLVRASEVARSTGQSVLREMLRDPRQAGLLTELHQLYHGEGKSFEEAWATAQERTGVRLSLDTVAQRLLESELPPQAQPVVDPASPLNAAEANRARVTANTPAVPSTPPELAAGRQRVERAVVATGQQDLPAPGPEHYDEDRRLDRRVTTAEGEKLVVANESLREKGDRRLQWVIKDSLGLHDDDAREAPATDGRREDQDRGAP